MTGPINSVTGVADSGTTLTVVDASVITAIHQYDGCVLEFTSGSNVGKKRVITSCAANGTVTFAPAVTAVQALDTFTIHKWENAIDFR
jgi:hypothetical protein